jgi:hypothetical protein
MALCRLIVQGWALRLRRLMVTGLAFLLILVALPALAKELTGPIDTPEAAQVVAGSFRLAQVRILGVPVLNVASRSLEGPDAGPDAAERARVIEGNLDLLHRPQQPCTPGERIGELLLDRSSFGASEAVCDPDHLALQGSPAALRVVVQRQADGLIQLAAAVPGRATTFPLLTVTDADTQLNGMTAEQLAEHWRGRLERRLRRARGIYASKEMDGRMRVASFVAGLLTGLIVLAVWMWRRLQRQLSHFHRERVTSGGRFAAVRFHLAQTLSRLLMATVLLLGVAIGAVVLLAWPGQVAPAIDVLFQPLVVLFKALLLVALAALLQDFVAGLVLLLDDRYAIGDTVEIGGRLGEVIDVGVLSTELRCQDQRVVVVPNSGCDQSVNHTKLRSGAEVSLLLPKGSDLPQTLDTIGAELAAFSADPVWGALLLEPPSLLGVEAMTADGLLTGRRAADHRSGPAGGSPAGTAGPAGSPARLNNSQGVPRCPRNRRSNRRRGWHPKPSTILHTLPHR